MNKKTKSIVIASIVVLILGVALFPRIKQLFAPNEGGDAPSSPPSAGGAGRSALTVSATVLEPQVLNNLFRITGILLPDEEVDLIFETSGRITNIVFEEGTHVRKGELLAKGNDAPLQAELLKLQAQLPLAEDRVYRQQP